MIYDVSLKELLHQAPQQLLQILTGSAASELLNIEYPTVRSRRPDLVARLTNGQIFHLELQASSDAKMAWRMLEYYALIAQQYSPPLQQVLYVGEDKPNFDTEIRHDKLHFEYELRDIRDIDCNRLLQSDSVEDNILAVLCRLDVPAGVLRRILSRLATLDDNARKDKMVILAHLTKLRRLHLTLQQEVKEMSIQLSIEDNIFLQEAFIQGKQEGIQQGIQQGVQQGIQQGVQQGVQQGIQQGAKAARTRMLRDMIQHRFGKLPKNVQKRIEAGSLTQLEEWLQRGWDAKSVKEIFN